MKASGALDPHVVPESSDPTDVRSIAVTAEDIVAAYEASLETGTEAVLRVTPPFSGRMRARLHVVEVVSAEEAAIDAEDGPGPLEIPPADLVRDVPEPPRPDDTEDVLRADPDVAYTRERHRKRHEAALATWREQVRASIADAVVVETPEGPTQVEVAELGG